MSVSLGRMVMLVCNDSCMERRLQRWTNDGEQSARVANALCTKDDGHRRTVRSCSAIQWSICLKKIRGQLHIAKQIRACRKTSNAHFATMGYLQLKH